MFTTTPQRLRPFRSPAGDLVEANNRLQRRVGELQAVQEMAQAITCELRLDALLETALATLSSLTGAQALTLLLAEPSQSALVVRARRGGGRHAVGERIEVGRGLSGWVAEHRVPLLLPAVEDRPEFRALARAEGCDEGSFVAVPLMCRDRLLGVVCAAEKAGGLAFDERDLRILICLAPHLTIAIHNATRFQEAQERALAALNALAESARAAGAQVDPGLLEPFRRAVAGAH